MPTTPRDIFERQHHKVFGWLLRLSGERAVAEDLTQEVFLRVVRSFDRYDDRGREASWVFRIARNLWRNHLRDRKPPSASLDSIPPPAVSAVQGLRPELAQALEDLEVLDRECFLLREIGGLGYEEITEVCDLTPAAVRSRIYRARKALRTALSEGGDEEKPIHAT